MSLVSLVDYFSDYAAYEFITTISVLRETVDGVGEKEAQAAEGRTAMEGIDRMAQDERDVGRRRETDGYELLSKDIVCKVIIR